MNVARYIDSLEEFQSTAIDDPHTAEDAFLRPITKGNFMGESWSRLDYTKHFVGVLSFLTRLTWMSTNVDYVDGAMRSCVHVHFHIRAFLSDLRRMCLWTHLSSKTPLQLVNI